MNKEYTELQKAALEYAGLDKIPDEEERYYQREKCEKYDAYISGANWQDTVNQLVYKKIFNEGYEEGFERGRDDVYDELFEDAITCKVSWYDGQYLDFTQEQQDKVLEKIGAKIDDEVKVIIIKEDE